MKKIIALLICLTLMCTCSINMVSVYAQDAVETDYGTIPAEYANASDYPVAVFKSDNTFLKATKIFADGTGNCALYFGRGDYSTNKGKYILLRADMTTGAYDNTNYHYYQQNIIDLGGHTLTLTSNYLLNIKQRYDKDVNILFKNGTIVYPDKILTYNDNSSWSGTAEFNFTFDNVTFRLSEGSTSKSILTNGINGTDTVTSTITLNNCTFDLTAKDDTVTTTVFDVGSSTVVNNITVKGGKLITDSEVIPYSVNNEESSISFDDDENGNYIKVIVPAGTDLSSLTLPCGKNIIAYKDSGETEGDFIVYVGSMVKEDVETPYGTIPADYADISDYPVVVFKNDGTFLKATNIFSDSTSNCAMYFIRNDSSKNQGKYLLLRDDVTMSSMYQNTHYHYNQSNVIDLGGNTLTVTSASMLSVIQRFTKDVNITIKNGTIVYADKILGYGDTSSYTGTAKFNFTFEDITFKLSDQSTSVSAFALGNAGSDPVSGDILFDNCTFDLTNKATSTETTVFNLALGAVTNNITVKGGSIITNDADTVVFTQNDATSSIKFVADDEGKYTSLVYPLGSDMLNAQFPVEGGVMYATVAKSDENSDYFELSTEPYVDLTVKTPYGTIPAEYSDSALYPVAIFKKDGTFFKGVTSFADGTANCGLYWIRNDNSYNQAKYLLLRADAVMGNYPNVNYHYNEENIVDLGGNTLTVTGSHMFRLYQRFTKNVNITFKNGTIVFGGNILNHTDSKDYDGNAVFNLTFEDITFKLADQSTSESMITDGLLGGDTVSENLNFKNCTFDLRGKDATTVTAIFDAGSEKVTSVMNVQGGQIIADSAEFVKIANANSASSSVTFIADADGNYTTLKLPSQAAPSDEVLTTDGGKTAYELYSSDDGYAIYKLVTNFDVKPGVIADTVTIYAINIDKEYKLYAATYIGNELADCKIIPVEADNRITVSETELSTDGCDVMKVFLWDNLKPVDFQELSLGN